MIYQVLQHCRTQVSPAVTNPDLIIDHIQLYTVYIPYLHIHIFSWSFPFLADPPNICIQIQAIQKNRIVISEYFFTIYSTRILRTFILLGVATCIRMYRNHRNTHTNIYICIYTSNYIYIIYMYTLW